VLGIGMLLFGGKKLPELARGSGKALRIFKTEVNAFQEDVGKDDGIDDSTDGHVRSVAIGSAEAPPDEIPGADRQQPVSGA
jgi:sec-independent protein translocase protein TatA